MNYEIKNINLKKKYAMALENKIKNHFFIQIVVRSAMFLTLIGYVICILLSLYFFPYVSLRKETNRSRIRVCLCQEEKFVRKLNIEEKI